MKLELLKKKINKKKIFITGNTGFVGSWLSIMLTFFGAKILGFSLKKKDKKFISNHVQFKKNIQTIYSDINLIDKYKKSIKKFNPQIVIHLASQPLVLESYKNTKICWIPDHVIIRKVKEFDPDKDLRLNSRLDYSCKMLLEYSKALVSVRNAADLKTFKNGM